MNLYKISMEGEHNFTKEDIIKLSENNISDIVICVRDKQGGSLIIKPDINIRLRKYSAQLNYNDK